MSGSIHFFKFCLFAALFSQEIVADEKKQQNPSYVLQKTARKCFIGLPLRTDNFKAHQTIPAHWERFYKENVIARIPGKVDGAVMAVYTEYEKDHTKPYTMILGCETASLGKIPEGLVGIEIPASRYAVFTSQGPHPDGLIQIWHSVWNGELSRSFTADFELYPADFDPQKNPQAKIFVAIE